MTAIAPRKSRRKALLWAAAALIPLAGVSAWTLSRRAKSAAPPPEAKAERQDLEVWFREIGVVEPKSKVDVKSSVTGRVVDIHAREGDSVSKGQALAVIQPGRDSAEGFKASTVRSPMAGVVTLRKIEAGDSVVSGLAEFGAGNVLFTVADLSAMLVRMNVNEVDIGKLSPGQTAEVRLDAFPGEAFPARIGRVSPAAEKGDGDVKIFKAEVEIDKPDPRLRPGMTAHVKVLVAKRPATLLVPLEALFEEGDGWAVYVPGKDSAKPPEKRPVRLGLRDELKAEVLSGLSEGEAVSLEKPKG